MGLRSWSVNRRLGFARSAEVNFARARELGKQANTSPTPTTIAQAEKLRDLNLFANDHHHAARSFQIKAERTQSALHPTVLAEHVRNAKSTAINRHVILGTHAAISAGILEKSQNPADARRAESLLRKRKRHAANVQTIRSLSQVVLRLLGQKP